MIDNSFVNSLKRLRRLWRPPRLHGELIEDRNVSFLELFYDLVYVALIAAAAHNLGGHMNWAGVGEFVVLFSLIWIAWLNGAAHHDLHGREDVRTRAFTFVQMLLVALMAVYAADGAGGRDQFSIVYGLYFGVLGWLWFTVYLRTDARRRRISLGYLVLIFLTIAAVVGSVFASTSAYLWLWGASAFVWVGASFFMTRTAASWSEDQVIVSDSFVERFGLFTIIVLGEVVVGVVDGISESARSVETIMTGMLALGIGFGLWWTYFDLTGRRPPREDATGLPIWIVLHLPLTMAIAAAGAAMISVIEHAGDLHSPAVASWVLSGSVAVAFVAIAAIVRTLRDWARYRLIYLPTSIFMVVLALAIIPIGLLRLGPIALVSSLLGLLTVAWLIAVYRWLRTESADEP